MLAPAPPPIDVAAVRAQQDGQQSQSKYSLAYAQATGITGPPSARAPAPPPFNGGAGGRAAFFGAAENRG